jgi:heme exporter protein D
LDRLAAFRFVYAGIFAYVVLSVATIELTESLLDGHFRRGVDHAVRVSPADGSIVPQIQERLRRLVNDSPWTRIGGVRVDPLVLGADGRTPLYLAGRNLPPPPNYDPGSAFQEADRLLPAIAMVTVTLPLDSLLAGFVWVAFGTILIPVLFLQHRSVSRRETAILEAAQAARDATAERARSIQTELEKVRSRLTALEPVERARAAEIATLEQERESLQAKIEQLGRREDDLRHRVARSSDLEQERQALEDLLDEAVQDLDQKEGEIRTLQERLKRAAKAAPSGGRARVTEQLVKRMRTLYRNLEIDDRAIQDLVALGDEKMRLRAEESFKKLDEGPEAAGVRRKVGGLPPHLSIFELGFAGKGRIYYARGKQRPFRVLAIGAKNSQNADLEYLSRLTL